MESGRVLERWNCGGVDVGEPERRMIAHHVAAAQRAPFALRHGGLGKRADVLATFDHFDRRRLPQRERVDRRGAPRAARRAVAKTLALGRADHFDFHFATKARALENRGGRIAHVFLFVLSQRVGRKTRKSNDNQSQQNKPRSMFDHRNSFS